MKPRQQARVIKNINRRILTLLFSAAIAWALYWRLNRVMHAIRTSETAHILQANTSTLEHNSDFSLDTALDPISTEFTPHRVPPPSPTIPKVALLFLTKGPLPLEAVWVQWLTAAAGQAPTHTLPQICEQLGSDPQLDPTSQLLYSVYVHAPSSYEFPASSFWHAHRIPERVHTAWASHSLMAATRHLVERALQDPGNAWFLLVSESDVPLYDPLTTWQQLMGQQRSHVNACPGDPSVTMLRRWSPKMETERLKVQHWRKSNQFFALTRAHAEVVAQDTEVYPMFEKHCAFGYDYLLNRTRDCMSDEHYIPTLFAVEGLEQEMNCESWGISMMHWGFGGNWAHPRTFYPDDLTPDLIKQLRGQEAADVHAAQVTAAANFTPLRCPAGNVSSDLVPYAALPDSAKLTARKFADTTLPVLAELLASCESDLYVLASESSCVQG